MNPTADPGIEVVALAQYMDGFDEHVILAGFTALKPNQAEAEAALRPIHDDPRRPPGAVVALFAKPATFPQLYEQQDKANPANHRYCVDNAYVRNEADVPAVLEEAFMHLPSRKSFSLYFAMAPTSRRTHYNYDGADPTGGASMAVSMQSDHYFALYTVWEDEKDDEHCITQTHRIMKGIEKHSVGSYLGDADMQKRDVKFWRDGNAKRLMEIRRKWDPAGRICGFLDQGDRSGVDGLRNVNEWEPLEQSSSQQGAA